MMAVGACDAFFSLCRAGLRVGLLVPRLVPCHTFLLDHFQFIGDFDKPLKMLFG
jgi:hypothetical protein